MTVEGLRARWNHLRLRLPLLLNGLAHGSHPHVDIARRLTRTRIEVIFDVGANRGQTARELRRFYPAAAIHCFEPAPETYALLHQQFAASSAVRTHRLALSSEAGAASMHLDRDDTRSTLAAGASGAPGNEVAIERDTLDLFCERQGVARIDYLKIDTEGHDLSVLQGAERMLAGHVALVEVEAGMNPDNNFHVGAFTLAGHLEARGYRLFGVYEQTLEWPTADAYLRRANMVFVGPETIERNRWVG